MCSEFEAAIHQYVRNRLEGDDLRRLQVHFQICGKCRHETNVLRWRALDSGQLPDPPTEIKPQIVPPKPQPQVRETKPVPRQPMSMKRALIIGVAVGIALTFALAPFVPSVWSVEPDRTGVEMRHLNARVNPTPSARPAKKRKLAGSVKGSGKSTDPITMKLLTDDPDIVIHWTVE